MSEKRGRFVHLSPDVDELLRTEAKRAGVPMSALVDTCVRAMFGKGAPAPAPAPQKLGAKQTRVFEVLWKLWRQDVNVDGVSVVETARYAGETRREAERCLWQLQGLGYVRWIDERYRELHPGRHVRETRWLPERSPPSVG